MGVVAAQGLRGRGFRTKLHFFRTAIVLPISALGFLPNPEFKPHVPCVLETRGSEIYIFTYNGLDEMPDP